jgi:STE24 endopeptidase
MNRYQLIILFLFLLVQGAEYWLELINLRYMKKYGTRVPEGFEGAVDEPTLKKTHAYTVETSSLSLVESLFDSGLLLVFIFGGLLNLYNSWVVSLNLSFVFGGAVFFLLLTYASTVLSISFSLYGTFRIEKKYGFNTMSARLWIADLLKNLLITTVLLGALLICGLWIIRNSPDYWWLFIWGFFFIFSIFMMYISPYVIEPLFNKFTPLEVGSLEERIRVMMEKTGIRVSRVFAMDASKRSRHSNAYFSGIGKVKRIVLFDTLIQQMSEDEILGVLAHEAGHWKKKHVLKMIAVAEVLSLAVAYIAFRVLQAHFLDGIFSIQDPTFFSSIVILGFLFSIVSPPFTPLFSYFSRRHENEADSFAAELTANAESLATALIKLSKENLSNLHPHPLYAKIYYSHPPVVERVKRLREAGMTGRNLASKE